MPIGSQNLADLHSQLVAAGIPIDGVSVTGGVIAVQYQASATPTQITNGNSIAASFTPQVVYRRKFLSIYSDLTTMASGDPTTYAKVIRACAARLLQGDPKFTAALNNQLGTSIGVTTTDPTQAD